jgi:hypothetical protein
MAWSDDDLREMVAVLAAPPERQLEWLRADGADGPSPLLDELALQFGYEFDRVRSEAMADDATAAGTALLALDHQLEEMSGRAHTRVWRSDALTGPEWTRVRELATRALGELTLS